VGKRKKQRGARQSPPPPAPGPNRALWIAAAAAVLFLAGAAFVIFGPLSLRVPTPGVMASKADEVGAERLVGRWLRPDGGYVLEIRAAQADGRLEAAYLNPRPITVARAEWRREGGRLRVFVELRDVNYPGSTYTLSFLPEQDRLVGVYFQAVQRQTFNVEFVRQQ